MSGSAATLQTLQGSAINKIPNILQCTLPPRPMCQTLLSDFSRVWLREQYLPMTMHACAWVCVCVCIHTCFSWTERDRLHLRALWDAVFTKQIKFSRRFRWPPQIWQQWLRLLIIWDAIRKSFPSSSLSRMSQGLGSNGSPNPNRNRGLGLRLVTSIWAKSNCETIKREK